MFIRQKNYIKTYRLNIGLELGAEKAEDAYIVLREPSIIEITDIDGVGGGSDALKALLKALPSFFVEHNIYNSETEQATPEQVVELITGNISASVKVLKEYFEAVKAPFRSKKE